MKKTVFLLLIIFVSCSEDDPEGEIPLEEENFSTELFFSEYIEGTSFNKSLEIVNLTGETINLEEENYSIQKQQNGSGDWMSRLELTGTIAHKEVFVISNESADLPEIIENAAQLKTGAPLDFNGNDPVALFKDEELIDVIGEIDNADDFAIDETLRRKTSVTEPSTEFDADEWERFETNAVNDLGDY